MSIHFNKIQFLVVLIMLVFYSCNNSSKKGVFNSKDSIINNDIKRDLDSSRITIKNIDSKISHRCDITKVGNLYNNIESVTLIQIEDFLLTFDESCNNSAEYMEFSNEMLFKILLLKPYEVIQLMVENEHINNSYILEVLKSPVNDGIDIKTLVKIIEKLETENTKLRDEIKNSLESALLSSQ